MDINTVLDQMNRFFSRDRTPETVAQIRAEVEEQRRIRDAEQKSAHEAECAIGAAKPRTQEPVKTFAQKMADGDYGRLD